MVTYHNQTPTFEWWVVRYRSKNRYQEEKRLKNEWTTYSGFVNHSRLNSHHNWVGGGPMWPTYGSLSVEFNSNS